MNEKANPTEKFTVLVVEDNFINQELMREMLDRLNCHVDTAENGLIALDRMKTTRYHMVFMDLHMPEMDGFEVAREVRKTEQEDPIPIIATTANVTPGIVKECLEAGMDAYLAKPFQLKDIESLLNKYCPK
ncbi:MAG: response regulator [Waddliaceae bacterium]